MKKILLLAALIFPSLVAAQGSNFQTVLFGPTGRPLAGAQVTVCASGSPGIPCSPTVPIYLDQALTQPQSNPIITDSRGNWGFWAAPGTYEYTVTGIGVSPAGPASCDGVHICPFIIVLPCATGTTCGGGGGGGSPATPAGSLQKNSFPVAGTFTASQLVENASSLTIGEQTTINGATAINGATTLAGATSVTGSNPFSVGGTTTLFGDFHASGANPYFDIVNYGGYSENFSSPSTMSCSITTGTTALNCASNPNFANGQGLVVPGAGLTPAARNASFPTAPAVRSVIPIGVTGGGTTYAYQLVLEDYFGGLTAAGTSGQTTTGAASLGVNTVALTNVTRTNGVETYTCSSNCNVGANSQIQISGFTNLFVDGTVVVNTTPTNTTFTVLAPGLPDYIETASATLSVRACNEVFPNGTLTQESVILRTWIYRAGTLVGVSPGQDPFFIDCGQGVSAPSYVPTSAPGAAAAGYLAATISSGGGTTALTLSASAGTSVASATVVHDNSPALKVAIAAAFAAGGGDVRLPVTGGSQIVFPFNSTMDMTTVSNPTGKSVKVWISQAFLNQPWIPSKFSEFEGLPQRNAAFQYGPLGIVFGSAHPLFLANANTNGGVTINKLVFVQFPNTVGQSAFVSDETLTAGGETGFNFNDDVFVGNSASAVVIKGGFDFRFTRGTASLQGAEGTQWFAHPCYEFTNASTYLGSTTQVPGRVYFDRGFVSGGTGIQFDNIPLSDQPSINTIGGVNLSIRGMLHENNTGPGMRMLFPNTTFEFGIDSIDFVIADYANGFHQPLLEMTGTANFSQVLLTRNSATTLTTLIAGGPTDGAVCVDNIGLGCGTSPNLNTVAGRVTTLDGGTYGVKTGGSMGYLMDTPAAPASCVVSAGGAVPVTTGLQYFIVASDRPNPSVTGSTPQSGLTVIGPACTVNTTTGNQTVTVTRPSLPVGASGGGWFVWRGTSPTVNGEALMPVSCSLPIPAATTTYVDTSAGSCGASAPSFTTAFRNAIRSDAVSASSLILPTSAAHGVLLGEGTSAVNSAAPTGNSQCFLSDPTNGTTVDPAFGTCPGGGGGTPAGSTNSVQYNNAGAFGGAGPGITGQLYTSQGSASPPAPLSPGVADGNGGAAVTTTPYAIACDSGTSILDRVKVIRLQSGASVVNMPDHTLAGCGSNFVVTLLDDGAGSVTVNRGGTDTFSIFSGATNTDGATTFTLQNGQYATVNNGTGGIWEVRLSGSTVTLQTNTSNNGSQTLLNLLNSAVFNGITLTLTNTSGGNVQLGATGTLNNSGLTNAATTVNGQTCTLGSACTVNPPLDKSANGLSNPTADATFTHPNTSTTGTTLAGTAPASSSGATGTNASSLFNVSGVTGGADSNATGTAGVGSSPSITTGTGGAGTGTNTNGGAGGSFTITTGAGGAAAGSGNNSNGGNLKVVLGAAGTGGSGTPGACGQSQVLSASTVEWEADCAGNTVQLGAGSYGASPPACTAGTAGAVCLKEGTDGTNVASTSLIDANSTTHEFSAFTAGSTSAGMLVRAQPGPINQTAKTAAITTATLCAASAGACNVTGQYHVHWNFWGSGTACSSVTAGSVTFLLTWTDENAVTHSAVALPMQVQTGAATMTTQSSFPFQTALANESASGDLVISTNGTVIQYATGYTACTTGTGTYNLRVTVARMQ